MQSSAVPESWNYRLCESSWSFDIPSLRRAKVRLDLQARRGLHPPLPGNLGSRDVLVFAGAPTRKRASAERPALWAGARRRRAPDPPNLMCLRRFLLLSFGSYVPAPARLAPPSSGPASRKFSSGARSSLLSSGNFPALALRVDRLPSGTAAQASPAGKKQRGRGQLLAPPQPQTHPQPQEHTP